MYYFLIALTLILITLKLMGTIALSWGIIIPIAVFLCLWPLIVLALFIYLLVFA